MTAVGRLNEVCGMWNMEGLRGESHLGHGLTGMGCLPMPATRSDSARPMPAASGEFENNGCSNRAAVRRRSECRTARPSTVSKSMQRNSTCSRSRLDLAVDHVDLRYRYSTLLLRCNPQFYSLSYVYVQRST